MPTDNDWAWGWTFRAVHQDREICHDPGGQRWADLEVCRGSSKMQVESKSGALRGIPKAFWAARTIGFIENERATKLKTDLEVFCQEYQGEGNASHGSLRCDQALSKMTSQKWTIVCVSFIPWICSHQRKANEKDADILPYTHQNS